MKRKSGFTLAELIIVISAGSSIMLVAIGVVHRVMTIHSTATRHANMQNTAERLARQLRWDLHRAESAELTGDTLDLTIPTLSGEQPTTYVVDGALVKRTRTLDEERLHRDIYSFESSATIELSEASNPPRIIVAVNHSGVDGAPQRVLMRVEASVGRLLPNSQPRETP